MKKASQDNSSKRSWPEDPRILGHGAGRASRARLAPAQAYAGISTLRTAPVSFLEDVRVFVSRR